MKTYVCGFMFSPDHRDVALIHKTKGPDCVLGKLNGIGGKVEREDYRDQGSAVIFAQIREFKEEAGVQTVENQWRVFAKHTSERFVVYFLVGEWDNHLGLSELRTMETEVVCWRELAYNQSNLAPNLNWLLKAAIAPETPTIVFSDNTP
jgi:8-oxo-dGTP pyrophosphatase MutT (NUDIX family)